jgi:hypothetical protein
MCNVTAFNDYVGRLEDYLEYVNTDVDRLMAWEPELYAAFGTHNNKKIEEIKDWYEDAEDLFISTFDPELYIAAKYETYRTNEDLWDLVDREIDAGTIYECGGYWFRSE